MYISPVHRIEDQSIAIGIMHQNPFAILVSNGSQEPTATHIPILVENSEPIVLMGHMARANSHWQMLDSDSKCLVIFHGPHGYVSPSWYSTRPNVPTWNYVSVHAYCRSELILDEDAALSHLSTMVNAFDPYLSTDQPESMDVDYHRKLLKGLVVFRLIVERLDAKAKLNQNKMEVDRLAVKSRYSNSEIEMEQAMGEMMSGNWPHQSS